MIHSHPDIAIPREIHLTLSAFRRRHRFGNLRKQESRQALVDWLIGSDNGFERLLLDEREVRSALAEAAPTIGSFVGTLLKLYADRHAAARFGDKRPLNVNAFRILFAMFPDLQFVDVVRDPRAVVASTRKVGWLDKWHGGSLPRAVDAWVRAVRAGMIMESRYRADQYLRVLYEDLVANPEATLRRLCRFARLNEVHLPRMLRFHEADHEIPPDMRRRYHPLIDKPLTADARERWRTELADEEVAFIESVAGPEMARFGYPPTMPLDAAAPSLLREWRILRLQRPLRRLRWTAYSPFYPYPVAAEVTEGQRRRAGLERRRSWLKGRKR